MLFTCCNSTDAAPIGNIAYDVNPDDGYTVFIRENTTYVPYLVLMKDYGGNGTLLLRKHLLTEPRVYDANEADGGYYATSDIDRFLNDDFMACFTQDMRERIVTSGIIITDTSSLGTCGNGTESIGRDVFLLSYHELGLPGHAAASAEEGRRVAYFSGPDLRIARLESGEARGWWLLYSAVR